MINLNYVLRRKRPIYKYIFTKLKMNVIVVLVAIGN